MMTTASERPTKVLRYPVPSWAIVVPKMLADGVMGTYTHVRAVGLVAGPPGFSH